MEPFSPKIRFLTETATFWISKFNFLYNLEILNFALKCSNISFFRFIVPEVFVCAEAPCPHKVDCFISRPTEKTIFFNYKYGIAILTCLINILEVWYIGWIRIRYKKLDKCIWSKLRSIAGIYTSCNCFKIKKWVNSALGAKRSSLKSDFDFGHLERSKPIF